MVDTPKGRPEGAPGEVAPGAVTERMQALLSRAVEDQVSEQRAVSSVLFELRGQVGALSESVRAAASEATVGRLGGLVTTVVADLRTSTTELGQRIDVLTKRLEQVAADTSAPAEQAAVRLAALGADVRAQGDALERLQGALESLAAFPTALAAMQKDLAGLHGRLQPLAEIRAAVGDLGSLTTTSLEALRPALESLQAKVETIGGELDAERLRDAVVDALGGRLDRIEQAADRPVVGPEVLRSGLGDLRASLDSAVAARVDGLGATLTALDQRLTEVGGRVSDLSEAAGAVSGLATDVSRLAARVEDLSGLRQQVAEVGIGVAALREDNTGRTLTLGLAALRDEVEHLGERLTDLEPPPVEEIAALVSQQVTDRLIDTLVPRITDVVTRVSATLVTQLGDALTPRVKGDTELVVQAATAESERRVLAHVDEAILALAEALLRRRRVGRTTAPTVLDAEESDAPAEDAVPAVEDSVPPEGPPPADPGEGEGGPAATGDDRAPAEPQSQVQVGLDKISAAGDPPAATSAAGGAPEVTLTREQAAESPPPAESKATVEPFLERTPDVDDDDIDPVRSMRPLRAAARRPAPPAASGVSAQQRPARPQVRLSPSPPSAPPRQQDQAELSKRKPWWRPGG